MDFVHLRNHSDYSIHQGSIRCHQLAMFAAREPGKCVALTDDNNLFASIKFYEAARKEHVKPIFGIDCRVLATDSQRSYIWTLLAMDNTGLNNLKKISTKAYTHSKKNNVYINKEYIFEHSSGLAVLSGGVDGEIGQQLIRGNFAMARIETECWLPHFNDRFYIEVQRLGKEYEEQYIDDALVLAEILNCPVIATNNSCYVTADDYYSHEIKVCLQKSVLITDTSRKPEHTHEQYLKTSEQMVELFKDMPEAIINTSELSKRCNVEIVLGDAHLPSFALDNGVSLDEELRFLSDKGLQTRLNKLHDITEEQKRIYEDRLQKELLVIVETGFSAYFLIVHEFIQWSHQNMIPVGPGRGSVAGSLVAYSLEITNIDPIQNDLLFERFLNSERISMPDMDIDFSVSGRDRVIEHVTEKYGKDMVGQIITFLTIAAKNAIRDATRVLGHPYGLGDRLAKMMPNKIGVSLKQGIEQSEELKALIVSDNTVAEIMEVSSKLEGMVRSVGTHPAGVVIAPSNLLNFTAMYHDPHSNMTVTQLDKDDIEKIGLVKFDFLGLKTLTIIESAIKNIEQSYNESIDISTITLDDPKVYELLCRGDTDSVFQLESDGMKRSLKKLKPSNFEEIVAILALYRPGPMQFLDEFIDRKHGRVKTTYLHPKLEPILKDTFAIAVYQEQVMRIARDLAGYSLGNADLLRRAMGKKDTATMAREKETFINGATVQGTEPHIANEVFSFIEKFAEYGFNKSHSAAYAVLSYQTAWLKTYYPVALLTAVMNNEKGTHDKLYQVYRNCKQLGITVIPPHINHSAFNFTINEHREIVYGLGGIKMVGLKATQAFIEERKIRPYINIFDFCQRNDRTYLDKNILEALICAGAFDALGSTRAETFYAIEPALQLSEQSRENLRRCMGDMFGGVDTTSIELYMHDKTAPAWDDYYTMEKEKYFMGFYITKHPMDAWEEDIKGIITQTLLTTFDNYSTSPIANNKLVIAGTVVKCKRAMIYNQKVAYDLLLDDGNAQELFSFFETVHPGKEVMSIGNIVVLEAINLSTKFVRKIGIKRIMRIQEARFIYANTLLITIAATISIQAAIASLRSVLAQFLRPEGKLVLIRFTMEGVLTDIRLGENWQLEVSSAFLKQLHQKCPGTEIKPLYKR